ncbi:hypothetical protein GC177_00495 [bacterium]|nr:hypothetical protein [bacterium]
MRNNSWTITEIADHLEDAARTLHRLPSVKVPGHFSKWPPIVRTAFEQLQSDKLPTRLGPPTPEAISRMEKALQWLWWIDDELTRKIVWMRAEKVRWKVICWRLGMGKTKVRDIWTGGLLKICFNLNMESGQKKPDHSVADETAII